jgi:hypothetical protein
LVAGCYHPSCTPFQLCRLRFTIFGLYFRSFSQMSISWKPWAYPFLNCGVFHYTKMIAASLAAGGVKRLSHMSTHTGIPFGNSSAGIPSSAFLFADVWDAVGLSDNPDLQGAGCFQSLLSVR